MASEPDKSCFVITPIGKRGSEDRKRSDQMMRHLIEPIVKPLGYSALRADNLDESGLITNQIIERLFDDDLVIADLTGRNPNVFYELAVRHAVRRPAILLAGLDQEIPFDVSNARVIHYTMEDPDVLIEARGRLAASVEAIEKDPGVAPNPVSAARDLELLRDSTQPEAQVAGQVLTALTELREEIRGLTRPERQPRLPTWGGSPTRSNGTPAPDLGTQVLHEAFGKGAIVGVEPGNVVVVDFGNEQVRKLMWDFAPIHVLDLSDEDEDEEDYEDYEPDMDDIGD